MKKVLGKLRNVTFGFGGYQDACVGLSVELDLDGTGCNTFVDGGWAAHIDPPEGKGWLESDRTEARARCVAEVNKLLTEAKVQHVEQLNGTPVEATFDGNLLKSWRILREVL